MFEQSTMLYLYVETPLHAGAGAGVGFVDLPIQRERVTGYPMVNSGGIKGALRGVARWQVQNEVERQKWQAAFGPEPKNGHEYAGALLFGDARLLLFPVRSMRGIFAWTTSRDALSRFHRDAATLGISLPWQVPDAPEEKRKALVSEGSDITTDSGKLVLEEFSFTSQQGQQVTEIARWLARNALPRGDAYAYWRERLPRALVILPEEEFRDFTWYATEVTTRVQLDEESKTVKAGPWVEEHLPTDTLLYVPIQASRARFDADDETQQARQEIRGWCEPGGGQEVLRYLTALPQRCIQLGGNMTVGRGIVQLRYQGEA